MNNFQQGQEEEEQEIWSSEIAKSKSESRIAANDQHPLHSPSHKSTKSSPSHDQSLYFDALTQEPDNSSLQADISHSTMNGQSGTAEEREPVNRKSNITSDTSYSSVSSETIDRSISRSWTDGQNEQKYDLQGKLKTGLERSNYFSNEPHTIPRNINSPPFFHRNSRSMRLASQASIGTAVEGEGNTHSWRATAIGSTPLERTIDAIGMGRYQYAVLILSGFGWAADNMWLQGVAICLPRIQDEWTIPDQWIGLVSSSTFAGMMIGALAWGSYSDTFGRKNAFNMTLLITAIFGLLSSFAPNFPFLCLCLFLLGTGVGGSMPTDGTIFLEALPKRSHYLLTALSVFFAAGSVVTSLLAFFIVPNNSCGGSSPCLPNNNKGWRYLLAGLGLLTVLFVIARLVFFTLFESPKYLVSAGKCEEARSVLQRIAAFNGDPKRVHLSDVYDENEGGCRESGSSAVRPQSSFTPTENAKGGVERDRTNSIDWDNGGQDQERQGLMSNVEDDTDIETQRRRHSVSGYEHQYQGQFGSDSPGRTKWSKAMQMVPESWRPSLSESAARYNELFSPYWRKTTVLVWLIWTVFTLAYTMVNVFLPKYLESRNGDHKENIDLSDPNSRRESMESVMKEFLFYSLASLPGSLLGAYLIETPLGRIKSMALSTFFLALSLLAFALARMSFFVILSSCSISLFASISYAVIYSYSPEVFKTNLRGTASGTASALSRLAGILAPVIAGTLLQIDINLPLYLGFGLFAVTVCLQISLPYETRGRDNEQEEQHEEG